MNVPLLYIFEINYDQPPTADLISDPACSDPSHANYSIRVLFNSTSNILTDENVQNMA